MSCGATHIRIAALLALAASLLTGCASVPATRVVLMPDEDGHVGAVSVSNGAGRQRIDQAYAAVDVETQRAVPGPMQAPDRPGFEAAYRDLLKAQPSKPRSFILYFVFDSTTLTPESQALLGEVQRTVHQRQPTEVTVYGHADAAGAESHNVTLSAERARVVADLLRSREPGLPIEVQYFGDRAPLVPTRPGVPEPRNRRAEVVIL